MTKTVLITGCSSGIGHATAEAFLEDEWSVWATARDPETITALAEQGCQTAALDVTNARECEGVVEDIIDADGRIDCLVNNAGYAQYGPMEDVPTAAFADQMDVNLFGPHRLCRAALPHMRDAGDGTVINVSSVIGRIAVPGNGAYAASKFGLEAMSDAMRAELDEFGLDVVLVEPGPVASNFGDRALSTLENTERSEAYQWYYDNYEDASTLSRSSPFTLDPPDVATVIHDAAAASDPEPRYPVGQVAKVAGLAELLPGRLRDLAFRGIRKVVGN